MHEPLEVTNEIRTSHLILTFFERLSTLDACYGTLTRERMLDMELYSSISKPSYSAEKRDPESESPRK
jgi:hypothetical protein